VTLTELAREIAETLRRQGWMSPRAYKRHTHLRLKYSIGGPAHLLTKREAEKYLAWIGKGNMGTHHDMQQGTGTPPVALP
jgi:hypothetical protein